MPYRTTIGLCLIAAAAALSGAAGCGHESGSGSNPVAAPEPMMSTSDDSLVEDDSAAPPLKAKCGGPYQAVAGRSITFSGRKSTTTHPPIKKYEWDFGDGTKGTGPTPKHAYAKWKKPPSTKTYTVKLRITDKANKQSQCSVPCLVKWRY